MSSNFQDYLQSLMKDDKPFYTVVGANITSATIIGFAGDYVILKTKIGEQEVSVHRHFSNVEVIRS